MKIKLSCIFCCIICLICYILGSKNTGEVIFSTEEMTLNAGEYLPGKGSSISASTNNLSSEPFAYIDNLSLRKGSYTLNINYETDTMGNYVCLHASDSSYLPILSENILLQSGRQTLSTTVYVNDTKPNFRLDAFYCGTGSLTIKNITFTSNNIYLRYLLSALFLAFCGICFLVYIYNKSKTKEQKSFIFFITFISLLSSLPLFMNYMIEGHDIVFHLNRIEGIKDGLLAGIFPVKIAPTWLCDYGYASSIMYGDILLYIPALLRILGFPLMLAYKLYVFLINVATCIITYFCVKEITKDHSVAIVGSMLYTLSFYRFTNVYIRAAVGEYTAMLFLPLIVAGFYLLLDKNMEKRNLNKGVFLTSIGFSGIIQSHLITCEMVGIFVLLTCCLFIKRIFRKNTFLALFQTALWTILLNIWWVIPFLDYRKEDLNINVISNPYMQTRGVFLAQLFFPTLSANQVSDYSRYAPYGVRGEMPLSIGITFILGIVLLLYILYIYRPLEPKPQIHFAKLTLILSLLSLFMSTIYFPYDKLADFSEPLHKYLCVIQFPWRYLSLATVLLSFMMCATFIIVKENFHKKYSIFLLLCVGFCSIIPFLSFSYNTLNGAIPFRLYDNEALNSFDVGGAEYLPAYADYSDLSYNDYVAGNNVTISNIERNGMTIHIQASNSVEQESYIELPLFYYKGYTAIDTVGNKLSILSGNNKVIRIVLPANYSGLLTVKFTEPWYWRMCEIISLLSLLLYLFWHKKTLHSK